MQVPLAIHRSSVRQENTSHPTNKTDCRATLAASMAGTFPRTNRDAPAKLSVFPEKRELCEFGADEADPDEADVPDEGNEVPEAKQSGSQKLAKALALLKVGLAAAENNGDDPRHSVLEKTEDAAIVALRAELLDASLDVGWLRMQRAPELASRGSIDPDN
ncbi:hypothetical protein BC830DRAFT_1138091 [Chytriomyces sp. MP71]|nr:hypothetical protein BC830DRAFT_1138091 [Chytriomyces sp. MP71]